MIFDLPTSQNFSFGASRTFHMITAQEKNLKRVKNETGTAENISRVAVGLGRSLNREEEEEEFIRIQWIL